MKVPEDGLELFTNTTVKHRDELYEFYYEMSILNDQVASFGNEIADMLASADFELLRGTYYTFSDCHLEFGYSFTSTFMDSLNFNEEYSIILELRDGQV